MTGTGLLREGSVLSWTPRRYAASVPAVFTAIGWTQADWDDLTDETTWVGNDLSRRLLRAFLNGPPEFLAPVSPATVRQVAATCGGLTFHVLNAYAAGASPRFVDECQRHYRANQPSMVGWSNRLAWTTAMGLRMSEPEATGWAHTGLFTVRRMRNQYIRTWLDRFGTTAYLWVLAGYDLKEATAMHKAGTVVAEDQLRVMVALNGFALPAGV